METRNRPILEVKDLTVQFAADEGMVYAVHGVDLSVPEGRAIGIVGESGCGKTVTAYSLTKLLPDNARVGGRILYVLATVRRPISHDCLPTAPKSEGSGRGRYR